MLKELEPGLRLWCSLDDRAISLPILVGAYELAETRFVRSTVRPGDLAIDAGANIGYFTMVLAKLVGEMGSVEAFEPLPYLAEATTASAAENGFAVRVRVHRMALDETAGTLRLRHAPRTANFGGAHFLPDDAPLPPPWEADEIVRTAPLDEIVAGRPCAFLKMDVEGAEARLVRGAGATLTVARPVLLAELHDHQLRIVSGCSATDFIAQMAALGYGCSSLRPDGSRGIAMERYDEVLPTNVVFDPPGGVTS